MSNITNDRNEKVAKVIEYDMIIRGAYLAHVISIEGLVKDIISYHFCPDEDKRKQFISLILNGRDYTPSGTEILEKVLDIHYHDLTQRYPKLIKDFKTLLLIQCLIHQMNSWQRTIRIELGIVSNDDRGQTNYRDITRSEIDERLED